MKSMRTRNGVDYRAILGLVVLCLALNATQAQAWWNKDWSSRRLVSLDAKAGGGNLQEGLPGQEVLVRLHSGNFNFAAAKPDGGDLRFIGLDDKTILKHRIVAWSQADEMALVRVAMPAITGNTAKDGFFLYSGNAKAVPPEGGPGLLDSQQVMLLHLDESEGLPKDATVNGNNASTFTGSLATPAVVGSGISLFGGGEHVSLAASQSLALTDALTFTGWLKVSGPQQDAYIIHLAKSGSKKDLAIGVSGLRIFVRSGDGSLQLSTPEDKALKPDTWHHLALTLGNKGEAIVYLDGSEAAKATYGDKPGPFTAVTIGADDSGGHPLAADLDELGLANVARPAAWIAANYALQGPDRGLVSVGVEEVSGAGGVLAEQMGYFRIIFSNITIDGYVILGFLAIMGGFAWLVFLGKAYTVWMCGKDTKAFLSAYRKGRGRTCGADESEFESSPLYRVYKEGCRELKELLGGSDDQEAAPDDGKVNLVSVRSALDRGFVMESKNLNSWLTALIICTSGGPFLGLLGTVWGVMNTFAAMAAAGEANIMAIAPGVASALICTVTGLLVAIPSLMGYNFLVVKIKGITVDLAVFVDELAVTIEKRYGGA